MVPQAVIPEVGARIMDLQAPTNKMSKSTVSPQGTLLLAEPPEVTSKKIKSAVTDSGRDVVYDPEEKAGISNLLSILSAVTGRSVPDLEAEYGDAGYGTFKGAVADAVVEFLRPVRERYEALSGDSASLLTVAAQGAAKAEAVAADVMSRAKRAAGLLTFD